MDDLPWWVVRLYLDGLEQEFDGDEEERGGGETEVVDDITSLGITPQALT